MWIGVAGALALAVRGVDGVVLQRATDGGEAEAETETRHTGGRYSQAEEGCECMKWDSAFNMTAGAIWSKFEPHSGYNTIYGVNQYSEHPYFLDFISQLPSNSCLQCPNEQRDCTNHDAAAWCWVGAECARGKRNTWGESTLVKWRECGDGDFMFTKQPFEETVAWTKQNRVGLHLLMQHFMPMSPLIMGKVIGYYGFGNLTDTEDEHHMPIKMVAEPVTEEMNSVIEHMKADGRAFFVRAQEDGEQPELYRPLGVIQGEKFFEVNLGNEPLKIVFSPEAAKDFSQGDLFHAECVVGCEESFTSQMWWHPWNANIRPAGFAASGLACQCIGWQTAVKFEGAPCDNVGSYCNELLLKLPDQGFCIRNSQRDNSDWKWRTAPVEQWCYVTSECPVSESVGYGKVNIRGCMSEEFALSWMSIAELKNFSATNDISLDRTLVAAMNETYDFGLPTLMAHWNWSDILDTDEQPVLTKNKQPEASKIARLKEIEESGIRTLFLNKRGPPYVLLENRSVWWVNYGGEITDYVFKKGGKPGDKPGILLDIRCVQDCGTEEKVSPWWHIWDPRQRAELFWGDM